MGTVSGPELGRRLHLVRAAIWEAAVAGDLHARILRDTGDVPAELHLAAGAAGSVHRSLTGSHVVTDPVLATDVLEDPSFTRRRRDGSKADQQILSLPGSQVDDDRNWPDEVGAGALARAGRVAPADLAHRAHDLLATACRTRPATGVDLLGQVIRPLAVWVAAEVLPLSDAGRVELPALWTALQPVLDTLVTPQPLARVDRLVRAVGRSRALLGAPRSAGRSAAEPVCPAEADVALLVLLSSTVEAACATALEHVAVAEDRPWAQEPVRLVTRVAGRAARVGPAEVSAGDHVVLLLPATSAGDPLFARAWPVAPAVATLVSLVTEVVIDVVGGCVSGRPVVHVVRRPRSPVSWLPLSVTLTDPVG